MFLLKPIPSKGNKITMIGDVIKVDVLGLGIKPRSGKSMTTLNKNKQTGIMGGKPGVSVKEAGREYSKEDQRHHLLMVYCLPSPG